MRYPLINFAVGTGVPAYASISLLAKSIIKKSLLKSQIEMIDAELEVAQAISNDESVGRKRR